LAGQNRPAAIEGRNARPKEILLVAGLLASILTFFSLFSMFYLSQTIDDMLDVTLMDEFPRLLSTGFVTNAWFYPVSVQIKDGFDLNFLPSLIGNVVNFFVADWVLTQRIVAVLLVFGTALSMYYFLRRVGTEPFGALVGAVAYGFSDQFIMRMPSHLSLLSGFVFPLLMLALYENRKYLAGLMLGLAYWSSPFFGIMALMLLALYLAREVWRSRGVSRALLSKYVVAGLIFAVMAGPLIPFGMPAQWSSTTNTLQSLLWRNQYAYFFPGNPVQLWEQTPSYLGLSTVVLAVVSILRRRSPLSVFMIVCGAVFAVISLLPPVAWPFTSLREVTRFSTLTTFSLAFVAGQVFSSAPKLRVPTKALIAAIVLAVIIADNLVAAPAWYFTPQSAGYQWNDPGFALIAKDHAGIAEVDLPILPSTAGLVYYQYYGVLTGKDVVDGETSGLTQVAASDHFVEEQHFLSRFFIPYIPNVTNKWLLSYNTSAFATPTQAADLTQLRQMGIDYLILHTKLYGDIQGSDAARTYLDGLVSRGWLSLMYSDAEVVIYQIVV
jgi:MFS family permease